MRQALATLGLIAVGISTLGVQPAQAQTTATGPYYAAPSWDQKLQCDTPSTCPRFIVLSNWNNAAVLDRETGLVWERSPLAPCLNPLFCLGGNVDDGRRDWRDAIRHCSGQVTVGNRGGWRLPTHPELRSLIDFDPANASFPRLPPGHPFQGIQADWYWSATAGDTSFGGAHAVLFANAHGFTLTDYPGVGTDVLAFVWCVRGGQGVQFQ